MVAGAVVVVVVVVFVVVVFVVVVVNRFFDAFYDYSFVTCLVILLFFSFSRNLKMTKGFFLSLL